MIARHIKQRHIEPADEILQIIERQITARNDQVRTYLRQTLTVKGFVDFVRDREYAQYAHTLVGREDPYVLISRAVRRIVLLLVLAAVVSSCGSKPSFTVTRSAADPTYQCPGNAINAPYDLHATAVLHNPTSSSVTVTAVTAEMKLKAFKGVWQERIGDIYDAGPATFTPAIAPAGSDTTLTATIHSACTSPAYSAGTSNYGDYQVTLHIKTSAGSYSISAANLHRILTA